MSELIEQAIKDVISENWVSHWGNRMGSAERNELECQTLALLTAVQPDPLMILMAALIRLGYARA